MQQQFYLTLFASTAIIPPMILTAFRTRMGWVALVADRHGLIASTLPRSSQHAALAECRSQLPPVAEFFPSPADIATNALTRLAQRKLERYFAGERISFDDLPFDDTRATPFQQRVWRLTRAIPYGSTRTYDSLARAAGHPNAARAVGQCMARNPLPIIVPCHRVVGSTGNLRGFGGGLAMKRALLEMEGAL